MSRYGGRTRHPRLGVGGGGCVGGDDDDGGSGDGFDGVVSVVFDDCPAALEFMNL